MLNFHIVTIFPEFFSSPLACGLLGRAISKDLVNVTFHNPRQFSGNRHRHIDDEPYGGGPGMVMRVAPLVETLQSLPNPGRILLLSPAGKPFNGEMARQLATETDITLLCGRYEGMDARIASFFPLDEVCVGDAIFNGGETAALGIIEAASRFIPGFLGSPESTEEESLASSLLEYPQYTRPADYACQRVPEVLLNGNHAAITAWRRKMALAKTFRQRPELLAATSLDRQDAATLAELSRKRLGRNLAFCLFHYPVRLENGQSGTSSLTNLDIHDIGRISRAYGLGAFYVLTPLQDQLDILAAIIRHWTVGPGGQANPDRRESLELVEPVADIASLEAKALARFGIPPLYVAPSASWPKRGQALSCADVAALCEKRPVVICLGTARGLDMRHFPLEYAPLRPLRFLDANHLSVRAAAAIIADRILGDFN